MAAEGGAPRAAAGRRPSSALEAAFWGAILGAADLAGLLLTRSPSGTAYGIVHAVLLAAAIAGAVWAGARAARREDSALEAGALCLTLYAAVSGLAIFLTTFAAGVGGAKVQPGALTGGYAVSILAAVVIGILCGLVGRRLSAPRGRGQT